MKKRQLIWCLLTSMTVLGVVWAQNTSGGTEQAVAALEHKWLQALKTNDPAMVAPLLAEKYVNTSSDGKVTGKAEALAEAKNVKFSSAVETDMKVSVFGDTAIATYAFKGKGTDPTGKPFEDTERWTDTWVRMPNGQWQCVAAHGSPVKM